MAKLTEAYDSAAARIVAVEAASAEAQAAASDAATAAAATLEQLMSKATLEQQTSVATLEQLTSEGQALRYDRSSLYFVCFHFLLLCFVAKMTSLSIAWILLVRMFLFSVCEQSYGHYYVDDATHDAETICGSHCSPPETPRLSSLYRMLQATALRPASCETKRR